MNYIPKFYLYDSTRITLLYTFELVNYTNAPQSIKRTVEIEGQRGIGYIIIDGGDKAWDMIISGILDGADYDEITNKIYIMETTIAVNTPYILRFNKTKNTYFEYRVKRIGIIEYPESLRNEWEFQKYTCILKVNSW